MPAAPPPSRRSRPGCAIACRRTALAAPLEANGKGEASANGYLHFDAATRRLHGWFGMTASDGVLVIEPIKSPGTPGWRCGLAAVDNETGQPADIEAITRLLPRYLPATCR